MRKIRLLQGVVVVLAMLGGIFLTDNRAEAQALFRPASTADESTASAQLGAPSPQTIRRRLVRIDANALAKHLAPAGADLSANRASRAKALDGVVILNLFPDVSATFRRSDILAQDGGGYVWEGEVAGQEFHEALLIVRNGQVFGRIQLENRLFEIKTVGNGVHQILEYDPGKFPPGGEPRVPPHAKQNAAPTEVDAPENVKAATPATITILVAYTVGAKKEAGSPTKIKSEITQAVALANQSYKRAKVPLTLKLVGTMEVPYNEGDSNGSDYNNNLGDLTFDKSLKTVRSKREALKADMVSLFRKGPPNCTNCSFVCGLAWIGGGGSVMGPVTAADANYAFSVVGHGCAVNLAFGHELGHNMGMQHDRYVYNQSHAKAPNSVYNFGYTNLNKKVYTIMAYYVECLEKKGPGCAAVNYFSSPTIKGPGGATLGVATGKSGAADNSKRLLQTYKVISKYR